MITGARPAATICARVFTRPVGTDAAQRADRCLHQDHTIPADILPTELLGKHFAVLGTTGAGKSCAIVTILRALLSQHAHAHIIILDPHNEYAAAFKDQAEVVTPADLELPYWLLNFEELREMVIGTGSPQPDADAVLLNQVVTQAKRNMAQDAEAAVADHHRHAGALPPLRHRQDHRRHPGQARPAGRHAAAYHRIKERFPHMQADRRLSFMFPSRSFRGCGQLGELQGLVTRDNMAKILGRLFRVPVGGKPITVLDTSGVPAEILNVVVSLLSRMSFDFALWSEQKAPVLLVCEEAHRYAPADEQCRFRADQARAFAHRQGRPQIWRLALPHQPAAVGAGHHRAVPMQHHLCAAHDQPEGSGIPGGGPRRNPAMGLMSELPSLRNGQAIAVGEGVPLPTRIDFDRLPEEHQPA